MANKPTKMPEWNRLLANNVEPSEAKKDAGWTLNESPSSSFFNWLMNLTGLWFDWIDARTSNAGTAPRIGLQGIETTAGDVNGNGINATGNGTGAGVNGTGGATNAKGVVGTGTGSGTGVHGLNTAGTGYGVVAEADATTPARSALRVVPQDTDPSVPTQGDIYANSVTKLLKYYNGTAWVPLSNLVVTIGDGVNTFGDFNGTDQTPFVNAMAALPAGGGTIFVKRGTYTFTAKFVVSKANTVFIGEGRDVVLITGSIASDSIIQITATNVRLQTLAVQQTQGPSANFAVDITADKACIVDCLITHAYVQIAADTCASKALKISANNVTVRNSWIKFQPNIKTATSVQKAGAWIDMTNGTAGVLQRYGVKIVDCHFEMVSGVSTGGDSAILICCSCTSTGGAGIQDCQVSGNTMLSADNSQVNFGILITTLKTSTGVPAITNNSVSANGGIGISAVRACVVAFIGLIAQAAAQILTNHLIGNPNAGVVWTFTNVNNFDNSSYGIQQGIWTAASSGGAVTRRMIDTDLN